MNSITNYPDFVSQSEYEEPAEQDQYDRWEQWIDDMMENDEFDNRAFIVMVLIDIARSLDRIHYVLNNRGPF